MSQLQDNLTEILRQKNEYLLPSNLKAGVTLLGVEGNLQPDKPDQTKTVTPTTSQQTVTPDTGYELSSVTVNAVTSNIDQNIMADNIKSGVNILGVTGNYSGTDTSDATATVNNIEYGKTAYANGQKITGTLNIADIIGVGVADVNDIGPGSPMVPSLTISNIYDNAGGNVIANGSTRVQVLVDYASLATYLNVTPNIIKTGETILNITGNYSGIDTSDANAVVSNIEIGKTAYVNGAKITGTLPIADFVGNRNQSIRVTCYNDLNMLDFQGSVHSIINSADPSVPFNKAIITNTDSMEMMASYSNVASAIGLTANILKKDEEVLGITGTYEGIDTSDANATAADIAQGKTAYVDGVKITGTAVASHDSVKLFVSTTAMNNDNDKVLGDIAIVYDDGTLTGLYVVTSVNDTLTYTPLPTQLSAITSGDVYLNKVVMGADNTIVTGTIPVTASEVDTAVDTTEDILGENEPEIQDHYEIEYD